MWFSGTVLTFKTFLTSHGMSKTLGHFSHHSIVFFLPESESDEEEAD